MSRLPLLVFWVAIIMGASFVLYRIKYEVQSIQTQIESTSSEIAKERQQLLVEEAEWAHLNEPKNLRRLANKYLTSKNITTEQIAEIEAISFHNKSIAAANMDEITNSIIASYSGSSARP